MKIKQHYLCNYTHFLRNRLILISYILFFVGTYPQMLHATENAGVMITDAGEITIKVSNKSIKEVLVLIEEQSKFVFIYNSETVNLDKRVTMNLTSSSINEVMGTLLKGTPLAYEISARQILIFTRNGGKQNEQRQIMATGIVKDEHGEPLIGVSVQVKGTTHWRHYGYGR